MPKMNLVDRVLGWRRPRSTSPVSRPAPTPLGLWALLPVNALALLAGMALISSPQAPEVTSLLLIWFGSLNAVLGAAIAFRLRGYELPDNRRAHVRLMVQLDGTLGGVPCRIYDLSLGGASVLTPSAAADLVGEQQLEIPLHGEVLAFRTEVVRSSRQRGDTDIALRYLEGQDQTIARLAIALLSEAADTNPQTTNDADAAARAA